MTDTNNLDESQFISYSNWVPTEIFALQSKQPPNTKLVNVEIQRSELTENLGISYSQLAVPYQVHSSRVQWAERGGFYPDTDGLITDNKDVVLSLQTADCIPIFLSDSTKNIFGLVHAGWRGTVNSITKVALGMMIEKGSNPNNISIGLGASIKKCCYEVSEDVANKFESSCVKEKNGAFFVSIDQQITLHAIECGVLKENIYISKICTLEANECCSYRRDGEKSGRMISFMGYK